MNIYQQLNKMMAYIEENLFEEIELDKLSKFIGTSTNNFKNFFSILTDETIVSYIKYRRLSKCIKLLPNNKIIDVAILCGYNSRIAFSRSFKNFHGFSPSQYKTHSNFNYYNKLYFDENIQSNRILQAQYKTLPELSFYGEFIECDSYLQIQTFCKEMKEKYSNLKQAKTWFGLVYKNKLSNKLIYYVALDKQFAQTNHKIKVDSSTWLSSIIKSPKAKELQKQGLSIRSKQLDKFPDIEIYTEDNVELLYKVNARQ